MFSSRATSLSQQQTEQHARHVLTLLLPRRPSWPETELMAAAGLSEGSFHALMLDLLNEGVARRRLPAGRQSLPTYQAATLGAAQLSTEHQLRLLAPEARQVLRSLAKPDTALRIARALDLPITTVRDALCALHDRQLVTCRYVGMLNIYARAAAATSALS